jgi:D-alanyl-D-alanine carboxypeptidase (penicillin-binding protein 5/6)
VLKKRVIVLSLIVSFILNAAFLPVMAAKTDDSAKSTAAKASDTSKAFDLKAKASVLMDVDSGNILYEKNIHEKLPIASVTKVMSMLLVMEALDSGKITYEDMVPVSEHSYDMGGSQVYLKPGEEFTVLEMMKAVAIHSANDATVALAEKISGSEDAFVAMMNEKARELGMNDTNFLDCTGLTDDNHYSSALDVATMSRELIRKHPKVLEITSVWHDTFRNGLFSLDNTNKLIRSYQGANGLKTGFTTKAGHCLSASAKRNNLQLIAVVLGEPDSDTRFAEAKKLLDYGFANYDVSQVNKKGEEVGAIDVKKGVELSVKGVYKEDVNLLLKKGENAKIKREVKMDEALTAPVKAGQKIGTVTFKTADDKVVGEADIVAEKDVKKASFIRLFFRMVLGWFGIGRK